MDIDYRDVSTWSDEMITAAISALMDSDLQEQLAEVVAEASK